MVAFRLSFRNTLVGIGRVVSLLLGTNRLRKVPINNLSGNGLRTRPMARWPKVLTNVHAFPCLLIMTELLQEKSTQY